MDVSGEMEEGRREKELTGGAHPEIAVGLVSCRFRPLRPLSVSVAPR